MDAKGYDVAQGCTDDILCGPSPSPMCGTEYCDSGNCGVIGIGGPGMQITQTGNTLSGSAIDWNGVSYTLNGVVDDNVVSFTSHNLLGVPIGVPSHISEFTGVINGNIISGNFSGSVYAPTTSGGEVLVTWNGSLTVTIGR